MALAILADDLTGAADCAARCRGVGLPTTIVLGPPPTPFPSDAIAFTSDTRHLPPAQAAARVYEVLADLGGSQGVTWYKKIDSTLRGNLGAELDATLDALGRDCALVCPAFPAQGRGLEDGRLISSVAQPAHLPSLLAQQSRRPVAAIALADVRAGTEHLAQRLAVARGAAQLLVVDALSDEDLRAILAAAERALPGALLCGSAGLIGALAAHSRPSALGDSAAADVALSTGARALLVVGSGSTAARRQIAYLHQHQRVEVIEIGPTNDQRPTTNDQRPTMNDERPTMTNQRPTTNDIWANDRPQHTQHTRAGSQFSILNSQFSILGPRFSVLRDVLLHLPEPACHTPLDGPEARMLAAGLAAAALPIVARLRPALLIIVGGDTAAHVLGGLGVEQLEVLRELLPGIPLTAGTDSQGHELLVILKPGNYGDEETLATLLRKMRNEE